MTNGGFGTRNGRLGNQLFQVALLYALQQRRGIDFYLPHAGEDLWECFDLDVPAEGPTCANLFREERGPCNYDPRVMEQPDGTDYRGYFQSYRYHEGCKDELLAFLRFQPQHRAYAEAMLFAYRRRYRRPLVAVHVRRGDYVDPGQEGWWGNLAADGYYERAVELIGHDVTYIVFSDDLPWCRESLGIEVAEYADFDHGTSLCLMAGCDVVVVANSSYSWWGAYLNPAAEVYAPRRWFGPDMPAPNDRQDDIVPPTWRTIPTFVGCRQST